MSKRRLLIVPLNLKSASTHWDTLFQIVFSIFDVPGKGVEEEGSD